MPINIGFPDGLSHIYPHLLSQKINYLSQKPTRFYRCIGLEVGESLNLKEEIEPLWKKAEIKRLSRPNRQRAIGGGRPYHLKSLEDKILLVFMFYRTYLNYDLLGLFFGFNGSNAGRLIKKLEPVLAKRFKLPKRPAKKRISSWEELKERDLQLYQDLYEILIADATEQEIPKPKDKKKNKEYRSGRKKRHTLKTQIIINKKGQIISISKSFPGSWHDYQIFKKSKTGERLPRDIPIFLDKGYQGAQKEYPSLKIFIPKKANRWHKLTEKDKIYNKTLNKIRVRVEHSILKCKRFKILSQIYRHPLKDYYLRFQIIAGIINFQMRNKENLVPISLSTFTTQRLILSRV